MHFKQKPSDLAFDLEAHSDPTDTLKRSYHDKTIFWNIPMLKKGGPKGTYHDKPSFGASQDSKKGSPKAVLS